MTHVFDKGDVVRLKSGGPTMTVSSRTIDGTTISYACQWFEGTILNTGTFDQDAVCVCVPVKDCGKEMRPVREKEHSNY